MDWFAQVVQLLADPSTTAKDCALGDIFGESVPVWTEAELKQKLGSIYGKVDEYLIEINVLIKYKEAKTSYFIPLFCLNDEPGQEALVLVSVTLN